MSGTFSNTNHMHTHMPTDPQSHRVLTVWQDKGENYGQCVYKVSDTDSGREVVPEQFGTFDMHTTKLQAHERFGPFKYVVGF